MRRKLCPLALLLTAAACSTAKPVAAPANSPEPVPRSAPPAEERKPPQFTPTAIYSGGDGSSVEHAVVILADDEDQGIDREYRWIFQRYGKFRKTGVGLATVGEKKFDVVRVELPDHSEKEIFFDITSFFGKAARK